MARADTPMMSLDHAGQLDVGILQHRLDAIDYPRVILHHFAAHPRQLPQIPHVPAGGKTGRHQPILQQIADPLRVLNVGLASGHVPDVLGVGRNL